MSHQIYNSDIVRANQYLNSRTISDSSLRKKQMAFESKSLSNLLRGKDCSILFKLIVGAMKSACEKEVKKDFRQSIDFTHQIFSGKKHSEKIEIINIALHCHADEILGMMRKNGSRKVTGLVSSVATQETDSSFRIRANLPYSEND